MNLNDLFPSKYLKSSDIETPKKLFVTGVETERMQTGDVKPVLYFRNAKPLVLNKTNGMTLREIYGADTDDWVGKVIVAYATTTSFQGKTVDCIRLRAPATAKPLTAVAADAFADLDDEIPF